MSTRTQENIIAAAILAILLGVIYLSLDYGPRARMVPLPVAIFGVILVLIQIAWQNLRSTDELYVDWLKMLAKRSEEEIAPERDASRQPKVEEDPAHGAKRETQAYLLVLVFLGLILAIGPIPAMAVFTFGYFVRSGQYRWGRAGLYTLIVTVAVYLLFVVALGIEPYHGLLAPLFTP